MADRARVAGARAPTQSPVSAAIGAVATTTAAVIPVFLLCGMAVQIGDELGFDPAGLGVLVSLYFAMSALCTIPVGWLVERFGDRPTSRAGVLVAAASMLGTATLSHSYTTLLVLTMLSAGANSLGQLSANLSLARLVPRHRQGLSFGIKQSAIPVATLLAGASVPGIALTIGWRWAFVAGAALALTVIPLAPRGPRPPRRASTGRDTRVERATGPLLVLALGAAFAAGSASALGVFLVDSAVAQGISAGTAGGLLTLGSVVGAITRIGGGWWADRRGGDDHFGVLAASLAVGAGGLGLLALPGLPTLVIGTVVGYGLGWSWPGVLNFAVVRLNPLAPAAATSITQSGVYVGGCVGPLLFGLVAARSYPQAWLCGAAAMVVAAALILLGRRLVLAHPSVRVTPAATPSSRGRTSR